MIDFVHKRSKMFNFKMLKIVLLATIQARRNWEGLIFAKFCFLWIEKNSVKAKVTNYKASWNSPKFIDIYNIITELDIRWHTLSVRNCERFSQF